MAEKEEDELRKLREKVTQERAQNTAEKARYRAKYPEKMAAARKRYKEKHRTRVLEEKKRYRATHREQRNAYQRRRYRENEETRAYHIRYNQRYWAAHRDQILAKQREQYQRNKEQRQALRSKTLRVVLADYVKNFCQSLETEGDSRGSPSSTTSSTPVVTALGSKTLRVVLTDYRTLPSANVHTPVVSDVKEFCDTLEPEGESYTLTDLDSGEIQPLDQPAWDNEANQWLDDAMELLEDPSSLDDIGEVYDFLKDMSPEQHVL